jgi:pimeloyl-ACP methyl ester carboxylesterase/class 3 adenylate cyclase
VDEGSAQLLRFGPFLLDVAEHSLTRDGEPIAITPKLFELLQILAGSGGRLLKKDALMQAVWPDAVVEEGNLSKGIFLLRQALGDTDEDRRYIETVPRVGYRFVAPVTSAEERREDVTTRTPKRDEAAMGRTRYAKSGDVHIAYQVIGDKGPDLLLVPGWVSHVEYAWEDPWFSRFLRRLASFSRLILLDRRGTGLSDPVTDLPSLEQRMDDVRAVMDEAGSERATLFGISEGGPMCILFAATYPERTSGLALFGTAACWTRRPDYPMGIPVETLDNLVRYIGAGWGSGISGELFAPSLVNDESFRSSWARFERFAVSPAGIQKLIRLLYEIDVRHVLPAIRVPTVVVHREGDRAMRVEGARYMAEHIPGAKYVELAGADHFPFVGDLESIVEHVEELVTHASTVPEPDRVLATLLVTQLVGPESEAAAKRDTRSRELLEQHNEIANRELTRFRGRRVKGGGAGVLATFDGPARAIRCACAIRDASRRLGIEMRAGLHAGECELLGNEIGGAAVDICARVAENAAPGEVLVTSTVKDLIAGSNLRFADRGTRRLNGASDEWRLLAADA